MFLSSENSSLFVSFLPPTHPSNTHNSLEITLNKKILEELHILDFCADGGPRSQFCARLSLCLAPSKTLNFLLAYLSGVQFVLHFSPLNHPCKMPESKDNPFWERIKKEERGYLAKGARAQKN